MGNHRPYREPSARGAQQRLKGSRTKLLVPEAVDKWKRLIPKNARWQQAVIELPQQLLPNSTDESRSGSVNLPI